MIGPEATKSLGGNAAGVLAVFCGVTSSAAEAVLGAAAGELVQPIAASIQSAIAAVTASLDMKILPFSLTIRTMTKASSKSTFPCGGT
jgi:hypothetical protein